jgi:hypothetical protein
VLITIAIVTQTLYLDTALTLKFENEKQVTPISLKKHFLLFSLKSSLFIASFLVS